MSFNQNSDRFTTSLMSLTINKITKGNNFKNIPTLNLYYDYYKDKIYYNPSDNICNPTKMTFDIGMDTPFYPNSDGNCYSIIGKACYDAGFSQTTTY